MGGSANDDDDGECDSLIELSGTKGLARHALWEAAAAASSNPPPPGSGFSRTTDRRAPLWAAASLLLAALAGAYRLGLREGEGEARSYARDAEGDVVVGKGKMFGPRGNAFSRHKGAGTFTSERLEATRAECRKVTSLLEEYYFGKDRAKAMLMESWLDPWDFDVPPSATGDDALPRRRAEKLADTVARALVSEDQTSFLVGGIGSSVMAGHDNCRYDNYQSQMERLWKPVWRAAGMDFVFQNAGIGGNCGDSHLNQHFCLGMNVSPEVDIVHYSWTYFEHGDEIVPHEDLIRWAQLLPKRPPVHLFNTGTLDRLVKPMHTGPNTTSYMPDKTLTRRYAKYGYNGFFLRTAFEKGGHDYEAEKGREDDPIDRFGPGHVGDGYHNVTRYGEDEEDEDRRTSLGVVMRNWVRLNLFVFAQVDERRPIRPRWLPATRGTSLARSDAVPGRQTCGSAWHRRTRAHFSRARIWKRRSAPRPHGVPADLRRVRLRVHASRAPGVGPDRRRIRSRRGSAGAVVRVAPNAFAEARPPRARVLRPGVLRGGAAAELPQLRAGDVWRRRGEGRGPGGPGEPRTGRGPELDSVAPREGSVGRGREGGRQNLPTARRRVGNLLAPRPLRGHPVEQLGERLGGLSAPPDGGGPRGDLRVLREGGGKDDVRGKSERGGAVQFGARPAGDVGGVAQQEVRSYLAAFPAVRSGGGTARRRGLLGGQVPRWYQGRG
ncbi:hypothetical protein ACHAWF_006667 [Thalassiosira exigua]